jgi:trk system potassium uptake protein
MRAITIICKRNFNNLKKYYSLMFLRVGREDIKISLKDAGTILFYAGLSFLVPIIIAILLDKEPRYLLAFSVSALGLFTIGYYLKNNINVRKNTETKHAMLSIVIIWLVYCFFASLPFILLLRISFINAFFEAMSALTTTGLTVLTPMLDEMPYSLLFWRNFLGWIGGIGIVLMAFIGLITTYSKTTKLLTAEGRGDQLKENLKTSVSKITFIYIIMTIIGIILLFFAGQTLWEATNYSMSAISTNGMNVTSIGLSGNNNGWLPIGVNNYWTNIILIIIMIMGASSFALHYLFLKKREWTVYFKDPEFRLLLLLGLIGTIFVTTKLGLLTSLFHVFSGITCGGLSLVSSEIIFGWDDFVKMIIIGLMIIGGSAGSTAGGIKISRFIVFCKSFYWKIKQTILPEKSFFKKSYNEQTISEQQIKEINQFILIWIIFLFIGTLVITTHGYDLGTALFEVSSAQSNAGLSTGITNINMPTSISLMLIINMFIGRLEIIPIIASIGLLVNLRKKNIIIKNNKNFN